MSKKGLKANSGSFKKGDSPWNKGIPHTEEARRKNSEAHLGRPAWNKGLKNAQPPPWNKGKTGVYSKETLVRMSESKIGLQMGKNNPNWRGGTSKIGQPFRRSPEYKEWRNRVYKRDDYTCFACKQRGGELNAHHILSYMKYPEARLLAANGQTLCKGCHDRLHKEIH